jgi:hypothetical protein
MDVVFFFGAKGEAHNPAAHVELNTEPVSITHHTYNTRRLESYVFSSSLLYSDVVVSGIK